MLNISSRQEALVQRKHHQNWTDNRAEFEAMTGNASINDHIERLRMTVKGKNGNRSCWCRDKFSLPQN